MKKRAAGTALVLLEIVAVLLAVMAAVAAFLYWRLGSAPISLNLFKASAEFAIERRLPSGYSAEIADIWLSRRERRSDVIVNISGLQITDAQENEAASAPEISFSFDAGSLFSGKFGPKTIASAGAKFRIIRNERQNVEIPGTRSHTKNAASGFFSPVFSGRLLESAFERAEISNAEIVFVDIASGRSWIAPNAEVEIRRVSGGLDARLNGALDMDGAAAALDARARYAENDGVVSLVVNGSNFPVGDILRMFYGERAAILEAPVTGRADISLTTAGDVLASSFAARAGAGAVLWGGVKKPVSFIEWETQFDPKRNQFRVEQLAFDVDGSRGEIDGFVSVAFGEDVRTPKRVIFDLTARDLVVDAKSALPEPLSVEKLSAAGDYHVSERRLNVNSLQSDVVGVVAAGDLAFVFPRPDGDGKTPSMGVEADIQIDGVLDPQRLLKIWPVGLAMGARDWIEERVEAAAISNIKAVMDLAPGAIGADGGLPDEAMTVTFSVQDAKAYYVKAMTPLTGGAGVGVLRGNSFFLNEIHAQVGGALISEGEVEFPVFVPKWRPTYIRFTADGKSDAILGVLDEKPLSLLSKIDLSPDQFSGDAHARIEIMRPNKREVAAEEYEYKGTATFQNMTVAELAGDVELSDAKGTVDLQTRSMTVKADAKLSDAPINLVWKQNFFEQDGPSAITVAGEIDASTGDLFGVSSRQVLHGPITFSANAVGELGAIEKLDIEADFTKASLTVDALGWRKPTEVPAVGDIEITFAPDAVSIDKVNLSGDGVEISGALSFTEGGVLASADFQKFYLSDAADLVISAGRDAAGSLKVEAVGDFINAAPTIEGIVTRSSARANGGDMDWGSGLSVTARIERLAMRNNVEYRSASLDFWRDADQLQALDFTAIDTDGTPLTVSMALTGADDGPPGAVEARTSEIGRLLAGVFGLSSVGGGEGSMLINLRAPEEKGFDGVLEVRNLQIVKAPLLARIFSAGSLDGLANLLNGEGIDFTYAYGAFDFADGVMTIKDARATGPSVGVTAEGALAVGEGGEISLSGAVAPIYQLNSALGAAPIIGDILVGKEGEGIVALSYTANGAAAAPSVFVNPLSALTPGVLRRLMQPFSANADIAAEPPAQEPAPTAD